MHTDLGDAPGHLVYQECLLRRAVALADHVGHTIDRVEQLLEARVIGREELLRTSRVPSSSPGWVGLGRHVNLVSEVGGDALVLQLEGLCLRGQRRSEFWAQPRDAPVVREPAAAGAARASRGDQRSRGDQTGHSRARAHLHVGLRLALPEGLCALLLRLQRPLDASSRNLCLDVE